MSAQKLLDLLKSDFKASRQKVTVLGVDVFVAPLTIAENTKVSAMHPDSSAMRQAAFVVMKCTDESGAPIFTTDDKEALANEVAGERFEQVFRILNGGTVAALAEK